MSENIKSIKRTNTHQFSKLVEIMEANPEISRGVGSFGSSKKNQAEYWDKFAIDLNSLGPPLRAGKEWHKVWLDYKLKLKKKIAENKKDVVATGGGPYGQLSLSPLEQAVDDLLSLQQAVNPSGNVFGIRTPAPEEFQQPTEAEVDVSNFNLLPGSDMRSSQGGTSNRKGNVENERVKILQKQTETQQKLLETQEKLLVASDSVQKSLSEIAKYSRNNYELHKEHLDLLKVRERRKEKENFEKNRQHKKLLEVKLKKLEYLLQSLEK